MDSQPPSAPRYVSCDGPTVRRLRQDLGWTQADLSKRSGCSVRVIQKAEASGALAPATIDLIAGALNTVARPVRVADLSLAPLTVVQRFLDLFNEHFANAADHAAELLHEDFDMWCAGDPAEMPFAGDWTGLDGFAEYIKRFFAILTPSPEGFLRNIRYLASGSEVVCWCEAYAGVGDMPAPCVWIWHRYVVKDGKIVRYENHFDTQVGSAHLAEARARGLLGEA
ncbi:MAG: nuclear transport factor 2 family protein [Planctomycetota bacterium]